MRFLLGSRTMAPIDRLLEFFRHEIGAEAQSGFARLSRIPDSHLARRIAHYQSLTESDKQGFLDCCAHVAHCCYGFVIGTPQNDYTQHPYFAVWRATGVGSLAWRRQSVPLLRAMVQQYKIDSFRGVRSCVTKEEFEFASSIRSVKAPELRKWVRAALKPLGYYKVDELGDYCCRKGNQEFRVHVDFGGRSAQLRYCVARPEFTGVHLLHQFCFERALGFGNGDWDYIVEENVDETLSLFAQAVSYSVELPERIREATG
jgi:hypothetical protein